MKAEIGGEKLASAKTQELTELGQTFKTEGGLVYAQEGPGKSAQTLPYRVRQQSRVLSEESPASPPLPLKMRREDSAGRQGPEMVGPPTQGQEGPRGGGAAAG